jgi:hypothetical protein
MMNEALPWCPDPSSSPLNLMSANKESTDRILKENTATIQRAKLLRSTMAVLNGRSNISPAPALGPASALGLFSATGTGTGTGTGKGTGTGDGFRQRALAPAIT